MHLENIIGSSYGKWTVLEFAGRDDKSNQIFKCQCVCGTEKVHRINTLKSGGSTQCKSCHTSQLNKTDNIVGHRFGSYFVVEKIKDERKNEHLYICKCDCGTQVKLSNHRLKSGKATNCHKCRVTTHGMSKTSTFRIWAGMISRCSNPTIKAFKYYGGRGITVHPRWLNFENFLEDMGERPEALQIDRINNDGNYEPGNCRWVTPMENNHNRNIVKNKRSN